MIRLFTDGACKANGKRGAQAAFAGFFPENQEWSFAERIPDSEAQTNQRGELAAINKGVKVAIEKCGAPAEHTLEIYTDSTYSRDCLTAWLPSWLRNDWKTSAGSPVLHRDLIEETTRLLPQFRGFSITYVKAHTGKQDELSRYNDIVDKMAVGVLVPKEEAKDVSTTGDVLPGLPLKMMGGPVSEKMISEWCLANVDKLDPSAVKSALFTAFKKTVQKNGYDLEIQVINKTKVVRLVSATLVKEGVTIIKE
jgi:ribonuclease HI